MTTRIKKVFLKVAYGISLVLFRLIKMPYWWFMRIIVNNWGVRGLHSMAVGEFIGGTTKTRSLYREEMLLKTMILFVDFRGKSCLDLACNDGYWSFRLARFGIKRSTGIDLIWESIARANFLKYVYDFPSFKFKRQDIFNFVYSDVAESYDIILLLSIIYHLPEDADWKKFFGTVARMNNECLVIDSRWFEDDEYWFDKTSGQAIIETRDGVIKKWRPLRKEVFDYLYASGYKQIIEINPSAFVQNQKDAYGNGNPYTLENVSDYLTGNRTLVIACKKEDLATDILGKLIVKYSKPEN